MARYDNVTTHLSCECRAHIDTIRIVVPTSPSGPVSSHRAYYERQKGELSVVNSRPICPGTVWLDSSSHLLKFYSYSLE